MTLLKSHVVVWTTLATNFTIDPQSMLTFERRAHTLQFFYTELPKLGKALESGLARGLLSLEEIPFKRKSKKDKRPTFLHELFKQVFDKDGYLVYRPDIDSIVKIRQLTMMFYKFEAPLTPEGRSDAENKFLATDQSVKTNWWPTSLPEVTKYFRSLLPNDPTDIRPHHSNGATFERRCYIGRREDRTLYPKLLSTFGAQMFFLNNQDYLERVGKECLTTLKNRVQESRIAFVPKDSRGPRTICIEPSESMMIQKGLQQLLYDHIEFISPARGYINFTDQSLNRQLAQEGSICGKYATIDLKDASDLVSNTLLENVCTPEWSAAFQACRSERVLINGKSIELKKFASMGSALCFPVEAMIFWSIARTVADKVYVYGDDIIVQREYAEDVMSALESYGLRINRDKTLTTGFFRESCGGDYYSGSDITYIKCKSYSPQSFIAFANLIGERYGIKISDALVAWFENETGRVFFREPISHRENPKALVYYTNYLSANHVFFKRRWSNDYQCYEIRVPEEVAVKRGRKAAHDNMLYFDWLAGSMPANQPVDYNINREYLEEWERSLPSPFEVLFEEARGVSRQGAKPDVKFVWRGHNPAL